jgi:hypothetical protein
MISSETRISLWVAGVHFAIFLVTAITIASTADGQAFMLWGLLIVIDFPVAYLFQEIGEPYFIFGVLGTGWWYLVARFVVQLPVWINQSNAIKQKPTRKLPK